MAMDSPDLNSTGHCCPSHASPSLDSNGSLSPHLAQQLTGRKRQPHPVSGPCYPLLGPYELVSACLWV
ncbi:hypothetical protein Ddc_10549 [Ditylenchus destructor]|nr:hypothetical protein Ddc_10549 [Ditylenchus destructor]